MNNFEDKRIERYLSKTLTFLYARTVLDLLPDVVQDNCYACEIDDPSQVHHSCLMWTEKEHLYTYFDIVFNKIKFADIVIKFRQQVELLDIDNDLKVNILDHINDWCNVHKPVSETVRFTAEKLLSLENRFENE